MRPKKRKPNWVWAVFGGLALSPGPHGAARGEEPRTVRAPTSTPGQKATAGTAPVTVDQLAERLRAVEATNRELLEELKRTRQESEGARRSHDQQMRQLKSRIEDLSSRYAGPLPDPPLPSSLPDGFAPDVTRPTPLAPDVPFDQLPEVREDLLTAPEYTGPVPEYMTQPIEPNPFRSAAPRGSTTGTSGLSTIATPSRVPLNSNFGPGFQFQTVDEEFLLQIHIQSQIEARVWGDPNGGAPFRDGFYLPRQRIFFNGRITRPLEYVFSLNRGFGDLNILETFLNFHPDDRFQVRFGRYFTPLGYDQFAIRNLWLPTPERSLFTTNLGPNRQVGLMAWGFLFDKRLDYAAGIFSGPRNSFEDLNNAKDFTGYLNARPFQDSERLEVLKDWNIGTSLVYGRQNQPAVPQAFRVGAVAPTNASQAELATAPFLTLNQDVREEGTRLLGSVHTAYFRKGLSLLSEWNYGHAGYASPSLHTSADVPISAFYVTGAYFLTGEHIDRRAMIVPRRPLFPTRTEQRRGIGAWEVVGRYSELSLGRQIFRAGLADEHLWASSASTYELGMNWYWNEHMKVYMFWVHGQFDEPVRYALNDARSGVDMFWLRFQLFY